MPPWRLLIVVVGSGWILRWGTWSRRISSDASKTRVSPPLPPPLPLAKKVAGGDTLRCKLVFRPERPGEHSFQLPLSLEGIPSDSAKHLSVLVSAVGLKPTLTFTSTEVDFGRRVVSRDPCALKQYQGEFVLRNASGKVRLGRWGGWLLLGNVIFFHCCCHL